MSLPLPRWTISGLAAAATLMFAANAFPQQGKDQGKKNADRPDPKAATSVARQDQTADGVIVKADPIRKGAASRSDVVESGKRSASGQQITVNTAAVWRDWVRDQASVNVDANATPRAVAERGANSVATQGEPRSADTEVVVDIGPNTKIETRFRASTDETSKGEKTPAEATKDGGDPATDKDKDKGKGKGKAKGKGMGKEQVKVTRFQADDLKPGLFVSVDYRHEEGRNVATTVTVIRPVGGPDTPADTGAEDAKPKTQK